MTADVGNPVVALSLYSLIVIVTTCDVWIESLITNTLTGSILILFVRLEAS